MNTSIYWKRFLEKFAIDFTPFLNKNYVGEFTKDGRLFRVRLIVSNEGKQDA
jgi:hypothetical protein